MIHVTDHKDLYLEKLRSAEDAVKLVRSGDRVFVGFSSSVAYALLEALWRRRGELEDVEIQLSNAMRPSPLFESDGPHPFSLHSPFLGAGERAMAARGQRVDYTSVHLSQVDRWFLETARPTVCLLDVSPPDESGFFSLGPTGVSFGKYAKQVAQRIIVQVNQNTPYVMGEDALIHLSEVDAVVETAEVLPSLPPDPPAEEATKRISSFILEQIPDGATIQLGIGGLSTAIGYGLQQKNDLGIHTELFSEPMMHLMELGCVTNARKGYMDGKSVFAFAIGSQALYRFMDHNQRLYGGTFPQVNDPRNIAKNKNMISINTALAVNLFGEAAAEGLGWRQYSAVGGQLDFVRGAQWSEGGKSFLAIRSSDEKDGVLRSKITAAFPPGTPVTTPRSDVQYVVTEYGCVDLKRLTMKDRVRAMIRLAHPAFWEELTQEAREHGLI